MLEEPAGKGHWRGSHAGRFGGILEASGEAKMEVPAGGEEVRDLPGHEEVERTMVYGHLLNRGDHAVQSPLDRLRKPVSGEEGRIRRAERSA